MPKIQYFVNTIVGFQFSKYIGLNMGEYTIRLDKISTKLCNNVLS